MRVPASACRGSSTRPIVLLLAFLATFGAVVTAAAQTLFGPQQYTLTGTNPRRVAGR